jgi:putative FmdB family regulatory protein
MPLYEYECDACGHRFEVIQKFADPPVEICPACSGPVRKLQSAPAFQFKGSGWYVTDYARKGQGKHQGTEGGEAAKEGGEAAKSQAADGAGGQTDGKSDKADKGVNAGAADAAGKGSATGRAEKGGRPGRDAKVEKSAPASEKPTSS